MSVLATMLGAGLIFAVKTRHRRALRRRDQRREFVSAIQTAESETEVCGLLVRQLARAVPKADIIVPLRRNASDDRLESRASSLPSELARELQDAAPRDCLAVRTGQPHTQQRKSEALLVCRLCSAAAGHTYCVPSLVGGQVIGAVLVGSERPVLPADQDELLASVEQAAPVLGNLRTLALAEVRAQTDPLTGLANRREAIDTLHRMVAHAIRNATPLTALMIDIDHFKRLNDEHGHDAGDAALAAVTDTLRARLRGGDFAARWGGEEFLVLLPETEREGGVQVAEHMRETVARLTLSDRRVSLTASFGVAELPTDGPDADDLVRAADRALYAAKQAGRNRVVAISPPDPETLAELAL